MAIKIFLLCSVSMDQLSQKISLGVLAALREMTFHSFVCQPWN